MCFRFAESTNVDFLRVLFLFVVFLERMWFAKALFLTILARRLKPLGCTAVCLYLWHLFPPCIKMCNGSQVQGSTFSVKDKESIEDPKPSLKILISISNFQCGYKFWRLRKKSPDLVHRDVTLHLSSLQRTVSTPHSSRFASLALGTFYFARPFLTFYGFVK